MKTRIDDRFRKLGKENRAALVTFVTAGDPSRETSLAILKALPGAGADIIELGMPFTDPMAEGVPVQRSYRRALDAGQTMIRTLDLVRAFREEDRETPVILMGYYNPVYKYGVSRFLDDAKKAGVDGLIVVDLTPEEDSELCLPALDAGINFIRLATPTTDDTRLPAVLSNTSGFVYYVSVTGVTGTKSAQTADIETALARIKRHTTLPVAVGFGIKTPEQAASVALVADGVVVGSAIVETVRHALDSQDADRAAIVTHVTDFVRSIAERVHQARRTV